MNARILLVVISCALSVVTGLSADSGGLYVLSPTPVSTNLPDRIDLFSATGNAFIINWEVNVGGHGWGQIASTRHTMYIIGGTPQTDVRFESCFYVGCKAAQGIRGTGKVIADAILDNDFAGLSVVKTKPRVAEDLYPPLMYEHDDARVSQTDYSTAALLSTGLGRCQHFAQFFLDCCAIQGIGSASLLGIMPNTLSEPGFPSAAHRIADAVEHKYGVRPQELNITVNALNQGLLVEKWNITIDNCFEPEEVTGIPGQFNDDPESFFGNHYVVSAFGQYYDPSYGRRFTDLNTWEDECLAGLSVVFTINDFTLPAEVPRLGRFYFQDTAGHRDTQ